MASPILRSAGIPALCARLHDMRGWIGNAAAGDCRRLHAGWDEQGRVPARGEPAATRPRDELLLEPMGSQRLSRMGSLGSVADCPPLGTSDEKRTYRRYMTEAEMTQSGPPGTTLRTAALHAHLGHRSG